MYLVPADWSRLCHGLFWFVTPSPHWPSAALLVHYDLSMRDVAAVLWPLVPSLLLVTGLRGAWGVIMAALVWPLSSPTLQCVLWMIWSHFPLLDIIIYWKASGPLLMRKLGSGALDHLLCNVSLGCGSNTCISSILLLHFPLSGMETEPHHHFETAFLSAKLR